MSGRAHSVAVRPPEPGFGVRLGFDSSPLRHYARQDNGLLAISEFEPQNEPQTYCESLTAGRLQGNHTKTGEGANKSPATRCKSHNGACR